MQPGHPAAHLPAGRNGIRTGNLGQLALLVRGRYLVDAVPFSKVQGRPFTSEEIEQRVAELLSADTRRLPLARTPRESTSQLPAAEEPHDVLVLEAAVTLPTTPSEDQHPMSRLLLVLAATSLLAFALPAQQAQPCLAGG